MQHDKEIIFKKIDSKTIVWFSASNKYIVLEDLTADVIKRLYKGVSHKDIGFILSKKMSLPVDKTIDFILDIERQLFLPNTQKKHQLINDYRDFNPSQIFDFTKYYSINNLLFKVQFQSEHELSLIHPKFSHLEVKPIENISFHYKVFTQNKYIFLLINNDFIGSWSQKDVHFFQGKFSMQIVQDMHHKLENEWLGVFHASAVSNGKESMMFLGDSGNGKSTSLALLQANGYSCIADDFVPVAAQNNEVYSFPSAISIKRNSLETLLPYYPELENSAEFHFKKLNKIVRYLPPNNCDYKTHQPCKALIFIKYKKDVDIVFNKISNINAFENLIPDSWLSPIQKNTEQFLDWFVKLPCYEITYSNNAKMIKTVSKIFNNDL
jgi:hypothetical protein